MRMKSVLPVFTLLCCLFGCSQTDSKPTKQTEGDDLRTKIELGHSDTASMNVKVSRSEKGRETESVSTDAYGYTTVEKLHYEEDSDLPSQKETVTTAPNKERWRSLEQLSVRGKPVESKTWSLGSENNPQPELLIKHSKFASDSELEWERTYNLDGTVKTSFDIIRDADGGFQECRKDERGWVSFCHFSATSKFWFKRTTVMPGSSEIHSCENRDENGKETGWWRKFKNGKMQVEVVCKNGITHYKWYRPDGSLKIVESTKPDPTLVDTTGDIHTAHAEYFRPGSGKLWLRETSTGDHDVQTSEHFRREDGTLLCKEVIDRRKKRRTVTSYDADGKTISRLVWHIVKNREPGKGIHDQYRLICFDEHKNGFLSRSFVFPEKEDRMFFSEVKCYENGKITKIQTVNEERFVTATKTLDSLGRVTSVVEHPPAEREQAWNQNAGFYPPDIPKEDAEDINERIHSMTVDEI